MNPQGRDLDQHRDWIASARRQCEVVPKQGSNADSSDKGGGTRVRAESLKTSVIPGYEIVREIHRGGQGVVYLATQQSTRRTVAIKVMREGPFAGPQDHLRFEREVNILAQLSHPGIVGIIDRGVSHGNHYFVMEYVDGSPLDRHVRNAGLDTTESLALFADVCEKVNVAHLRGIIHRDLKPANILVDTQGQPHILDFGLAKSSQADAEASSEIPTLSGQFVGSLPWASPEQMQGRGDLLDVRTDVYSLGVILFQLLTGAFPHRVAGSLRDIIDDRVLSTPQAPSRAAESSVSLVPPPISSTGRIGTDLDTITLKCLQKDPERRYQTAGELARDVRHFLAGRPIEARRDSGWYVARKLMWRHRGIVAAAAAFVLLVIASGIVSLSLWRTASAERDRAVVARHEADQETAKATQVAQFAQEMLSGIDPATAGDMDKKLMRLVLDNAAARADAELVGQPEVEGTLRRTIALSYQAIGEWPLAEAQFDKAIHARTQALGENDPETLALVNAKTLLLVEQGHYKEAREFAEQAIATCTRHLGPEHRETLMAKSNLAEIFAMMEKHQDAEALIREVLEGRMRVLGPEHPETLTSLNNLAIELHRTQRTSEAEPIFRKVIEIEQRVKGPTHRETLITRNNLSILLHDSGRGEEAEQIERDVLSIRKKVLGEDHPDTINGMANLAETIRRNGDARGAEEMLREAIDGMRRVHGESSPKLVLFIHNLANYATYRSDFVEAERLFREALRIGKTGLPADHPILSQSQLGIGACLLFQDRFAEAEETLLAVQTQFEKNPETSSYWRMTIAKTFVRLYERWDAAEPNTGKAEKAAKWRATTQPATESE